MITAMLLGALQATTPAPASPAPEKKTVVRTILVRDGKAVTSAPDQQSVIVINNQARDCFSETRVDAGSAARVGEQEQFTRILVCNVSRGSPVGEVQRLRNTIRSIEADKNLSEEAKAQVIAALNSAIASLPASE